jgi:hypothetical protein
MYNPSPPVDDSAQKGEDLETMNGLTAEERERPKTYLTGAHNAVSQSSED